jgi:hypothetical protein|mmetsp:Transcript_5828/g.12730  ORF Transcript_5828/g.12730 Transcript_5828/m.12730 type:complete len:125 (-) Transcript_5828:1225-1599(-)
MFAPKTARRRPWVAINDHCSSTANIKVFSCILMMSRADVMEKRWYPDTAPTLHTAQDWAVHIAYATSGSIQGNIGSSEAEGARHRKLAEQLLAMTRTGGDVRSAASPAPLRTRNVEYTTAWSLT